jgi:hypothetical protein
MIDERGEKATDQNAKMTKAGAFLGSLKDALLAAGRDEMPSSPARMQKPVIAIAPVASPERMKTVAGSASVSPAIQVGPSPNSIPNSSPSAEDAARIARTAPAARAIDRPIIQASVIEAETVPTTRVVRGSTPKPEIQAPASPARTQLVRGRKAIERGTFAQDPVVGFLIVVGGPGLGSFRPVFEGNNTLGRATTNRVPLDFGDDTISSEAQAYVRYDSNDRSFLFVPNLAKTNVVSVNDKKPTGAVELKPMDVITLGRTQVAFVAFCGAEFDWSEISET